MFSFPTFLMSTEDYKQHKYCIWDMRFLDFWCFISGNGIPVVFHRVGADSALADY